MINPYRSCPPLILQLINDIKSELWELDQKKQYAYKKKIMKKETTGIEYLGGARAKKIK